MADSVIAELRGNPNKIESVLDKTGFYNIKNKGKHIHFAFDDEGGNGSCVVDIENLNYYRFSRSEGGDIFSAIMQKKELKFPQSISYIKGLLGLDNSSITFIDRKDKEKLALLLNPTILPSLSFQVITILSFHISYLTSKYD